MKKPRQRDDKDSKAILERRRFLIQSALAGLGVGALAASCEQQPQPCLSVRQVPPKTQTGAQPCLEIMPAKASTTQPGQKGGPSTQTPGTKSGQGGAAPCLSLPANPQPCLTPPPPKGAR
jgi:hypothetical protein